MDQLLEFISNNTLLAAGTVAMALAVIFNELRIKADGLTALPPSQVVRLINGGAKVVDIRDHDAYAKGHIVDSVNIPAAELAGDIDPKLKKASSVVLVCDSGGRTAPLVTSLRKKGLEAVFGLQGGLGAWRRDNLPIVSSEDG
ncbi:MAG: rhodanese-like domain-containing protein [Gammaproteobacteria bacterium]|nr:rhodanese-like domain-containing protein [Gammaproteobacteria bacterium]